MKKEQNWNLITAALVQVDSSKLEVPTILRVLDTTE